MDLPGSEGLPQIQAGIGDVLPLVGHAPEIILDYSRRIESHGDLQQQQVSSLVAADKRCVPLGRLVPPFVLYKSGVCPQVHGHGLAAQGAAGYQLSGHLHARRHTLGQVKGSVFQNLIPLGQDHLPDYLPVVVGLLMAGHTALKQPIIPLGVKQLLLGKACFLKAVVHIGGENKVVLVLHTIQKRLIHRFGRIHIAVYIDVTAPVRPVLFQGAVGVEPTGIHILKTVFLCEIVEVPLKTLPCVHKPRRGRQPGPGADQHGIRLLQGFSQLLQTDGRFLQSSKPLFSHVFTTAFLRFPSRPGPEQPAAFGKCEGPRL